MGVISRVTGSSDRHGITRQGDSPRGPRHERPAMMLKAQGLVLIIAGLKLIGVY
jgi:hypothetical protein